MNVLLVETKKEYTKSLCLVLQPQILKGIRSIYLDAQRLSKRTNTLRTFQKLLEEIPKWDRTTLTVECERIAQSSNCSYLNELITAVFVCYTKVLTAVQVGEKRASVDLDIPSTETFVHKCYIEAARRFWKEPYLLSANVTTVEYQKNLRFCERVINESIDETIRGLLPIQHIMQQYLQDNDCSSSVSTIRTDRTDRTDATLTTLRNMIRNNIVSSVKTSKPVEEQNNTNTGVEASSPMNRVTIEPIIRNTEPESYNYTTQQFLRQQDDIVETENTDMSDNETPNMVIQERDTDDEDDAEQLSDMNGGVVQTSLPVQVEDILESEMPDVEPAAVVVEPAAVVVEPSTVAGVKVTEPDENVKVITMDGHKNVAKRLLHSMDTTEHEEDNTTVPQKTQRVPTEAITILKDNYPENDNRSSKELNETINTNISDTLDTLPTEQTLVTEEGGISSQEVVSVGTNDLPIEENTEIVISTAHTTTSDEVVPTQENSGSLNEKVSEVASVPPIVAPSVNQDTNHDKDDIIEELNFSNIDTGIETKIATPPSVMSAEKENVLVKDHNPVESLQNMSERNTIDTIKKEIRELEESITARHMPLFH
jgi:hypothetical protein